VIYPLVFLLFGGILDVLLTVFWDVLYGRDRNTARLTLDVGLALSAFPLSVPV